MLSNLYRSSICCALFCIVLFSSALAQERITIEDALQQKLVRIAIQGTGGYRGECLKVLIQNLSPEVLSLEIPAGQIFASADSNVQDLIITKEATLALAPKERKVRKLFTMCTQASNMAPSQGERFSLGEMAQGGLLALAQKIARNGYQNSTAQSAVWSIANQESVRSIYGQDTAMVRDIAQTVSEATGVPMSEFVFRPRRHQITSIATSLEGLIKRDLRQARLDLVSPSGERLRTYFTNRRLERGFRQFKVGASHTRGDSAELYLQLMEGEEIIMRKRVRPTDVITPMLHLQQKVALQYEVPQNISSTVGIYDQDDNLYFLIKEGHQIRKGYNRGVFIASCLVPRSGLYYLKVKANGEEIAAKKLDKDAPPPQLFAKITLRGVFHFEVPETLKNAKVAIYTEAGEERRLIYEIKHLNAGNKHISYQFQHVDGPEAIFYIRLVGEDGRVVAEQRLSQ
ncbi:MAG: hypothetical protein AAFQ68_15405 [Bacteroidota bacterium]